jgi:SAM-dependent methyltransferase
MDDAMTGVANVEQAEAWNGDDGRYWVAQHDRHEAMLATITPHLFEAAGIQPADRVLDIGCGCGGTTRTAGHAARDGRAFGVDLSRPMLDVAERLTAAEGLTNVAFGQGDAQVHPFGEGAYDVAISRFGLMFFSDPRAAFANIAAAVRPGGRVAFLCWQDAFRNEQFAIPLRAAMAHVPLPDLGRDGPGPFSLADRAKVEALLAGAGCTDVRVDAVSEDVWLGGDVKDVIGYLRAMPMVQSMISQATDQEVSARILAEVAEGFAPYRRADGVWARSSAWLVTAHCSGASAA